MPAPRYRVGKDPELEGKDPDILVIEALQNGPKTRKQVRAALKKGPEFFCKARNEKTYDNWISRVVEYGIVEEHVETLELNEVGHWVASSHQGTIGQRIAFARDMICGECRRTKPDRIILFEPSLTGGKSVGRFSVDGVCPECKHRPGSTPEHPEWCNISTDLFSGWSEFDCMYQGAKKELRV